MKKSFMTRVLAVTLSAAMAFSMSSAGSLVTASAASTVSLKTTFKTLKVKQTYKMTLKNNTLNWKITKVTTSDKTVCTVYNKTASSVMLKGKGVGRAKITVKVKTTKRKYPKNIKLMKCTAKVVPDTTQAADTLSATATALSNTSVKVVFNKAIDAADAENFTVSDGVRVTKAELSEDKKTVDLTVEGTDYGKKYDVTVSGIKVAGEAQGDVKLSFTVPESTFPYDLTLVPDKAVLKSDGQTTTVIRFQIKDQQGKLVEDKGIEVRFAATIGKLAENRVSVEKGEATIMYRSEVLTAAQVDTITATIAESTENPILQGKSAETNITLTPNPDELSGSIGAVITSATAPSADHVVAYFDKEVNVAEFVEGQKPEGGKPDKNKMECDITSGIDNSYGTGDSLHVVGVYPVENELNALKLLVNEPLTDNANVKVKFTNKISATTDKVKAENTVHFTMTDARRPAVLKVESPAPRKIKVTFSEAVLPHKFGKTEWQYDKTVGNTTWKEYRFSAQNVDNYLIDGKPLSDYKLMGDTDDDKPRETETASSSAKELDRISDKKDCSQDGDDDKKGSIRVNINDKRNEVEIELGREYYLPAGMHLLQVSNVGDWAAWTDGERNIVNTESFNFEVAADTQTPEFTVTAESPEQYLLDFNCEVRPVADTDTIKVYDSSNPIKKNQTEDNPSEKNPIIELQEQINGRWETISNGNSGGKNPICVSKIGAKYLVEVRRDWTEVYRTNSTRANYFNKSLRLHVDAGKLVNIANNYQNADLNVNLDDPTVMKTADTVNPTIAEVNQATVAGSKVESWNVTFSEPVKIDANMNIEGLTPSETQKIGVTASDQWGVPVISAQFIGENGQTVHGEVHNAFLDSSDKVINVVPESTLSAGNWQLVLTSISDDYGNTTPTQTWPIPIDRPVSTTDFRIVWAAVSDDINYDGDTDKGTVGVTADKGNYIFVKFNKPFTSSGNSISALVTGNYTINGDTLPTGTNILSNIKGYDEHDGITDSITIQLPEGVRYGNNTLTYDVDGSNAVLNVSNAITALGTDEALSNGGAIKMPFQYGQAGKHYGSKKFDNLTSEGDAVWGNDPKEVMNGSSLTLDTSATANSNDSYTSAEEYNRAFLEALGNERYREVIYDPAALGAAELATLDLSSTKPAIANTFGRNETLTINRGIHKVDFSGITINGNVAVSTSDGIKNLTISNCTINGKTSNKQNVGSLTVNAPNVKEVTTVNTTVNAANDNSVAIVLNDVHDGSFVNNYNINGDVLITDPNAGAFDNQGSFGPNSKIIVSTTGKVTLKGDFKGLSSIEVNQAAELVFGKSFFLPIPVNVTANGAKITLTEDVVVKDTDEVTEGQLTFTANGRDVNVKIYVPYSKYGNVVLETNGGDFTYLNDKGKVITCPDNRLIAQPTSVELELKQMNVISGPSLEYRVGSDKYTTQVITGSALSILEGDGLDVTALKNAFNADSYKVSAIYTLNSTNIVEKKTEAGHDYIRLKAGDFKGTDTITVKLSKGAIGIEKTIYIMK